MMMRKPQPRFAEAVRTVLDQRGLSDRNAANRTGIDRLTLANMRDGIVPRLEIVEEFARTFDLDVNEWRELAGYPRVETTPDPTYEHLLGHTVQAYGGGPIPPEDLEVLEAILRERAEARRRQQGR